MLWGWTTTATRSYGTSYSQCASMTSRPLFMRVAESTVILAPMCQVGWARASGGRTVLEVGRPVAERAAGGRQDEPCDLAEVFAGEALPDRRVLRIDGPQPAQRAGLGVSGRGERDHGRLSPGQRHDQVAARHERLLVGRRHDLARGQRGQRGGQADEAARGDDHQVHVVPRRERQERIGSAFEADARRQVDRGPLPHRHDPRVEPARLRGQHGRIVPTGQRHHLELIGQRLEHLERLPADRPGRAQHGDAPSRRLPCPSGRHPAPA